MESKPTIVEVQKKEPGRPPPTLLKFQNGELRNVNKEQTQYCRLLKNGRDEAAMVVAGGHVYTGDMPTDNETDMYVCVHNRTTNKVRIMPIEQVKLSNHILTNKKTLSLETLSTETSMKKMLKDFGGRTASRFLTRQENLRVDVEVFKDELDAKMQATELPEDKVDNPLENDKYLDVIRPKCNKEATVLKEIYDISDIVPQELLDRLEEESKAVYGTKIDKMPISSEYLLKQIEQIQAAPQSAANFLKIKLIIYMDCLLNFILSRQRNMKKCELSRITEKVENDVRARFCDPNSKNFARTPTHTEKALCYFIVLALLIGDNFQVDVNVLTKELRTPRQKIMRYAHVVYARTKSRTDTLTLQLPSKMPPLPNLTKRSRV